MEAATGNSIRGRLYPGVGACLGHYSMCVSAHEHADLWIAFLHCHLCWNIALMLPLNTLDMQREALIKVKRERERGRGSASCLLDQWPGSIINTDSMHAVIQCMLQSIMCGGNHQCAVVVLWSSTLWLFTAYTAKLHDGPVAVWRLGMILSGKLHNLHVHTTCTLQYPIKASVWAQYTHMSTCLSGEVKLIIPTCTCGYPACFGVIYN